MLYKFWIILKATRFNIKRARWIYRSLNSENLTNRTIAFNYFESFVKERYHLNVKHVMVFFVGGDLSMVISAINTRYDDVLENYYIDLVAGEVDYVDVAFT